MNELTIDSYLEEDEEIIWSSIKEKNILYTYLCGIPIIILIIIIGIGIVLNVPLGQLKEYTLIFILLFIGFGIASITFLIYELYAVKVRVKLSLKELKNYLEFNILTNKRYLQKNDTENFQKRFQIYYPKGFCDLDVDVLSLTLKKIKYIIYNKRYHAIMFMTQEHVDIYDKQDHFKIEEFSFIQVQQELWIYIQFGRRDSSEEVKVLEILQKLLNLKLMGEYFGGGRIYLNELY